MSGVVRQRSPLVGADPDLLTTIAAILRRQNQLGLSRVEVALRPAVVTALFNLQQLLRRLGCADLGLIESRPVFRQLVSAMLRGIEHLAARIDGKPVGIANTGGVPLLRREALAGLICVVAPDAGSGH